MGCRLLNPTPVPACCLGIHGAPNPVRPGGTSPYMPLVMMRDQALFQPYYQLESASAADTARWLGAFTWFLKKVTLRAGGHKPLLLKSPVHTARVPLLLKLFPRAKFIYIHRDPYTVRGSESVGLAGSAGAWRKRSPSSRASRRAHWRAAAFAPTHSPRSTGERNMCTHTSPQPNAPGLLLCGAHGGLLLPIHSPAADDAARRHQVHPGSVQLAA